MKLFLSLSTICILFASCGEHFYAISGKEIEKLALNAKEPGYDCFLVSNNDTIKGKTLLEGKYKAGNTFWKMDGKEISITQVSAYQTKDCFRVSDMPRVYGGRVSMFMNQTVNYRSAKTTNSTTTFFLLFANGKMEKPTYNRMKELFKDCPAAVKEVELQFGSSLIAKPKYHYAETNDYRALIKILRVYDNCN